MLCTVVALCACPHGQQVFSCKHLNFEAGQHLLTCANEALRFIRRRREQHAPNLHGRNCRRLLRASRRMLRRVCDRMQRADGARVVGRWPVARWRHTNQSRCDKRTRSAIRSREFPCRALYDMTLSPRCYWQLLAAPDRALRQSRGGGSRAEIVLVPRSAAERTPRDERARSMGREVPP